MTGPLCPTSNHGDPLTLLKFQMAPKPKILISSGSKKKEPRYTLTKNVGRGFLSLHTSYTMDRLAALVGEDVSSECYVP